MLAAMFAGRGFKVEPDEEGAFFIDRDGTQFRHILNYLRSGKIFVPEDPDTFHELLEELEFFQVMSYTNAIREAMGKEFKFVSIGDTNGILYWFGTDQGRSNWTNPIAARRVIASCSNNWHGGTGDALAGRGHTNGGICNTNSAVWFRMDFQLPIRLSDYTAYRGGCHNPLNWRLEGSSDDGNSWTSVLHHLNDGGLRDSISARWVISTDRFFKSFRWISTGFDASGGTCQCLHLSSIDLYGQVRTSP